MDSVEKTSPQIALESRDSRQESLQRQLDQLDNTQPGEYILGKFLSELYLPENYSMFDQEYSEWTNVRYQPKAALLGQVTHGPLGDSWGIYEYRPIVESIKSLEDHFKIFPEIERKFKELEGRENQIIVEEIAQIITDKTDVPVIFSESKNPSIINTWKILPNGNVCDGSISEKNRGLYVHIYKGNAEIYRDLEMKGYSTNSDFTPVGDAIVINKAFIDDPLLIQTCLHELGHIAENRFILPQKEEEFKNISILNTEIISSLYGLKAAMLMATSNQDASFRMMNAPIPIYNWTLTGTTAP